ncbi:MAG: GNAT family N-acetyltransferase [Henriciella sp.]|nr:GNAT family N-acetyltransferase [Henriciella sp.]
MFELVALHECDPKRVARFMTLNRERFRPYAPTRSEHYYTNSHWRAACKRSKIEWKEGRAYRFVIIHKNEEVIGKIDLDHIRRGPFSTGDFGYLLDRRHEGQSIMRRAMEEVLSMVFTDFKLNRVQAAIMPQNTRSSGLVKRLGFREIGLAERYLKLDGEWRDHLLFELVARKAAAPAENEAPEKATETTAEKPVTQQADSELVDAEIITDTRAEDAPQEETKESS